MQKWKITCSDKRVSCLLQSWFFCQAIFFRRKSRRNPASLILLNCIAWVLVALMTPSVYAQLSLYWIAGTDNWRFNNTSPNWRPYAEPTSIDYATINNGGVAIITDPGEACNVLNVDVGTLQINSGSLSASWEYVGYEFTGYVNHSGGTNTVSNQLLLGYTAWINPSTGTYNLSGSGQLYAPTEEIGVNYNGIFNQTGGTNTISNPSLGLLLAANPGSVGTYNLNGGTLILGDLRKGNGTAAFNFGGGTMRANNSFTSSLPITLTGVNGNATIDTNNRSINLSGVISGSGGLRKIGPGTLTLSGNNTYTGGTTVVGFSDAYNRILAISAANNLGPNSNPLRLIDNAILEYTGSTSTTLYNPINPANDFNGGFQIANPIVNLTVTSDIRSGIGGFGDFGKFGPGTLTLTGEINNLGDWFHINGIVNTSENVGVFNAYVGRDIFSGIATLNIGSDSTFAVGNQIWSDVGGTINVTNGGTLTTLDLACDGTINVLNNASLQVNGTSIIDGDGILTLDTTGSVDLGSLTGNGRMTEVDPVV